MLAAPSPANHLRKTRPRAPKMARNEVIDYPAEGVREALGAFEDQASAGELLPEEC